MRSTYACDRDHGFKIRKIIFTSFPLRLQLHDYAKIRLYFISQRGRVESINPTEYFDSGNKSGRRCVHEEGQGKARRSRRQAKQHCLPDLYPDAAPCRCTLLPVFFSTTKMNTEFSDEKWMHRVNFHLQQRQKIMDRPTPGLAVEEFCNLACNLFLL